MRTYESSVQVWQCPSFVTEEDQCVLGQTTVQVSCYVASDGSCKAEWPTTQATACAFDGTRETYKCYQNGDEAYPNPCAFATVV